MRHARPDAIARLAPLLAELRRLPGLLERRPGTFYRGARAFLHFHEDAGGDFADLKVGSDWERSRATTQRERAALLRQVRALLLGEAGRGG